jgi:endoglucanase
MISHAWLAALILAALPFPLQAQLLKNPSFEEQPSTNQWFVNNGKGQLIANNTEKQDGNYSVLVTQRGETIAGPAQELKDVIKTGVNYRFSAYVKLKNPSSETFYLSAKQQDGNGTQYLTFDSLSVSQTGWTKLSGYFKPTILGQLKSFVFYIHGPKTGVDFYVDNVSVAPPLVYTPTSAQPTDFIRAKGTMLVRGANEQQILLTGANFIAYDDDDQPAKNVFNSKNFDEEDYKRLADMGMNVVRLNMWYKVFEDDVKPNVYKAEGWEWLEKNIIWARKYGVYLILDMHAAQGGYQSAGYSGPFWNSSASYRDRLKSLWKAIASRYSNEPTIAGYDLLNEPLSPTNQKWITYSQELANTIRSVDQNHLIIVEQSFADDSQPFVLTGKNIMYDFHYYEAFEYANQLIYTMGRGDGGKYPDSTQRVLPWSMTAGEVKKNSPLPLGTSDWKFYTGALYKVTNDQVIGATPTLISENNSGKVYFDDFIVKEYDANGNFVRDVVSVDLEKKPADWYFLEGSNPFTSYAESWVGKSLSSGSGKKAIETIPHRGKYSVSLSGTSGMYGLQNSKFTFGVKKGYSYQISGWMKGSNITGKSAALGFQFQLLKSGEVARGFDKSYLEYILLAQGLDFYRQKNVPTNIGEFGISFASFNNNKGGLTWVNDVLDLFKKYNVNAQYFNYHSATYGIYRNLIGFPDPNVANKPLVDLFTMKLLGKAIAPPANATNCTAVYSSTTQLLKIPCIQVNNSVVSVALQYQESSGTLNVNTNSVAAVSQPDSCVAAYLPDNSIFLPCLKMENTIQVYQGYLLQQSQGTALAFVVDWSRLSLL